MDAATGFLDRFGTVLLAGYFVVTFGVTALMNYTLQAISDKTDAASSWVAWIPIVQTHSFVRATQTSYKTLLAWFGGGIGLAVVGSVVSSDGETPGLIALLFVAYGVGAFVWFAGLLWRLAERRGLSGWVGLVCLIPLLGLPFYFYLAFHDGFVRPSAIGLGVTALLALVAVQGLHEDLGRARGVLGGNDPAGGGELSAEQWADVSGLIGQLGEQRGTGSERRVAPDGEGFLARLFAWGAASRASGEPEAVAIPDAVVCAPETRIVGARPPRGSAMWCERPGSGQKQGWYLAWHPDGSIQEAGRYVDGRREGVWTRFWDSGGRRVQVHFEHGQEHGVLVRWDELGRKQREIRYVHGEPGPS